MNFGELQSAVLARLNMGSDDPAATNVGSLVNEALHMVEVAHPNGWGYLTRTVTASVSTSTYTFGQISTTSTVARVLSAKARVDTVWRPLEITSPDEADAHWNSTSETGAPEAMWVEGQTFTMYPAPDTTYGLTFRVVISEPDLAATTDSPLLPERFHGAIIAGALVLYYETLQDTNRSQAAAARFDGWIGRMMTALREQRGLPRVRLRGDT